MASAGRWSVLESWLPKTVALPAPRSPAHGWAKSAPSGRASLSSRSEPIFRLGKTQVSFPQRSEIWERKLEKKLPAQILIIGAMAPHVTGRFYYGEKISRSRLHMRMRKAVSPLISRSFFLDGRSLPLRFLARHFCSTRRFPNLEKEVEPTVVTR